jgi:riboflavin biosynthesis pyrimidine reductase
MERSKCICHMFVSIDGKIIGNYMESEAAAGAGSFYEDYIDQVAPKAWGCGRVTYEVNYEAAQGKPIDLQPFLKEKTPAGDFVVPAKGSYAVCFDRFGKINWTGNTIEYPEGKPALILEVLTEKSRPGYLNFLRSLGIPYIIAGKEDLDPKLFLEKLKKEFGVETFALCGGGNINSAFIGKNLVDEISLAMVASVDGASHGLSFCESSDGVGFPRDYHLLEAKPLGNDVVWLRYAKKE